LKSSELFAALDEMNQHEPDLRAAWNWAVGRAQLEQLQMGAGGLGRFYFLCDRYSEGQVLFEHAFHGVNALKQSETLLVRACLANQAVLFLIWIKEFERARKILHEILEAYPLETELSFELRRQRALTWQALGDFQYNLREEPLTVALATYQKALQELRRCGTDWDRVEILLRNAECHEQAGNPLSNTLNLALEAQEVNAQIGDASLANQIKKQISAVRTLLGQYDEAIRIARELEVYYQGIYTQCSQVWYRGWMGWTYWLAGRLDEAREQLLMAADLKRQGGPFYPSYVNCIMELYNVDLFQGHYADVHNLTVGKIFQVDEPRRYIPWGYAEGLLGVLEGDYDRAMVDFNRWLDFCAKTPRPNGLGGALAFVGLTCLRQGERETGRQKLEEALEASLTYEWVFNYDCLLAVLALLLAEEGQTERALQVYAAACQEPLVATSVYFADLVGRRLLAQARSLPEAVYRAAWEKGQSMEMRAMTLELREELRQGTLLRTV
jgi:tetratricopeptide (TPR) repeat protein